MQLETWRRAAKVGCMQMEPLTGLGTERKALVPEGHPKPGGLQRAGGITEICCVVLL